MRYFKPDSLKESFVALADGGIALAGGTVLVPEIRHAFEDRRTLVDVAQLEPLQGFELNPDGVRIGAGVRLERLATSDGLGRSLTALVEAAAAVGNPQIRRAATVGGNIALGIPGADLPPALLVLDATVLIAGADLEKQYPIETLLRQGIPERHLIMAVLIPVAPEMKSGFRKYAWRQASGKTIVSVAVAMRLHRNAIDAIRIACAGASLPTRLLAAEEALRGHAPDAKRLLEAAEIAAHQAPLRIDRPPGEAYRRELIRAGVTELLFKLSDLSKSRT